MVVLSSMSVARGPSKRLLDEGFTHGLSARQLRLSAPKVKVRFSAYHTVENEINPSAVDVVLYTCRCGWLS